MSGQVVPFPTPYPELTTPQDVAALRDVLNSLIVYINTIGLSSPPDTQALYKLQNLADLTNVPAARSNLGLGSAAVQNTSFFDLAGAAAAAQAASLQKTSNLSDLNSAAAARTNLGLGTAATQNSTAFDAAGAAAARAAQGVNGDITALTALNIKSKSTNYSVAPGDQTIECDATAGAFTITYAPATVAGRVKILKIDATYNPVNISDGTNVLYSLVAPMNGLAQTVEIYTNGAALRIT